MFNHLLQLNVDKGDKKIYFYFAVYELDVLLKFNSDINCICNCYFCCCNSYVTTVKLTSKEVCCMYFNIVILLSDGGTLLNSIPVNDFAFVLLSLSCSDVPPHDECLFVVMFL
jgi:hypothetical protein